MQEWVTWALQLLIAFLLYKGYDKIEALAAAIVSLKNELLKDYLPRSDFETYRKETRDAIHDLRNKMTDYEKRLYEGNR